MIVILIINMTNTDDFDKADDNGSDDSNKHSNEQQYQ